MVSDQVRAEFYLTHWLETMADTNPLKRIVWLASGSIENESMVVHHLRVMQDSLTAAFPTTRNFLYTNCSDVGGWEGSYVIPRSSGATKASHGFEKAVSVVESFWAEEKLTAELVITNGLAAAFALYGMGRAFWNLPRPPVIVVLAKASEGLWDYVSEDAAISLLRYLGMETTCWFFTLDNDNERRILESLLTRADQAQAMKRVRSVNSYTWDPSEWVDRELKTDSVVWSGRDTTMKNPKEAREILALLPRVVKEIFIPRMGATGHDLSELSKVEGTTLHSGEPPEIYRTLAGQAKAFLATSTAEGMPAGYVELMGKGCVPVMPERPWALGILPDGWPLLYNSPGEGAAMVEEAITSYDEYAPVLQTHMLERFGAPCRMAELVAEVWDDYTLALGDRIRMVGHERGGWRNL